MFGAVPRPDAYVLNAPVVEPVIVSPELVVQTPVIFTTTTDVDELVAPTTTAVAPEFN